MRARCPELFGPWVQVVCPVWFLCLAWLPLHAQPFTSVEGQLTCATAGSPPGGDVLPFTVVATDNAKSVTEPNGHFVLSASVASNDVTLRIDYDGKVEHAPDHIATRLQVMDEGHATRS